jgi:signal transduction histidine kinase
VIENRSLGLVNFVNQYKSLITLPVADFKTVSIKSLLERVCLLQQERLKEKGICLQMTIKNESLSIHLDPDLIEQVLLNLINNAADALAGCANPSIELIAEVTNHKTLIYVADNGTGIDKTVIDKIFIPFFTTKNTGSGIGLSLSKQIMRLHGGGIEVICPEGGWGNVCTSVWGLI